MAMNEELCVTKSEEWSRLYFKSGGRKKGGRPKSISYDKVKELIDKGLTHEKAAEILGCAASSISRVLTDNF